MHTDPRREEIWVAVQGQPISHFTHALRQEFFDTVRPASTLVEVGALAVPSTRVEIDAIAGRTI